MQSKETEICFPTFLYIGAGKAGSSWIYEILREHPDVFVPDIKDVMYFDRYYDKGQDWYLAHFRGANGYKAVGEISHDYFLYEETSVRIKKMIPGVKLIVCLREGVDRTYSEFLYDKTLFQFFQFQEYQTGLDFKKFATDPDIIKRSDYYTNLKPYYGLFPKENIKILFYDDLKNRPDSFAKELFEFLNVDSSFQPKLLYQSVNTARVARNDRIARFAYQVGSWLRSVGKSGIVGRVKRDNVFEQLLYKRYVNNRPKPDPKVVTHLQNIYHRNYAALENLTGINLPEDWY